MTSLRNRLGWSLALSLGVLFALQWAAVSVILREVGGDYVSERLGREAEALLAAVQIMPDGTVHLDPQRLDPTFQRVFSGHYFAVEGGSQRLRSRSLWDTDLQVPAVGQGEEQRLRVHGPQRQQLLVVARGYRVHGQPVSVAVGEDISPYLSLLTRLQWGYGLASLAVLGLLVMLQRVVVDRSLRPLHDVREDLRRVQAGEADAIRGEAPAEIAPLVDEVNTLLTALRERLTRSRQALGNLAHALKTQLAVLRHELEQPGDPGQLARLSEPVEVMTRLVQRELKRARLAGAGPPGQRADLGETLDALREALQKIYADKHLALEVSVPPHLIFAGDAEDLLELAGNLLDNACKWCRHRVRVGAEAGDALTLIIEDDGPGMGEDALEALPRRGVRADESVPGQGLGIAISTEVANSYGGSLRFDRSPTLGGLRVRVTLPRHP